MKTINRLILSTSPLSQPAGKPCGTASFSLRQRLLYGRKRHHPTGKERDSETGLYYFGARYLDGRTGRWISGDPALGEYVPQTGGGDKKLTNGGVYNTVNFHAYHYSNNNPIKYTDPDGESPGWPQWSPQAGVEYTDVWDDRASIVFNIDATKLSFDKGTMRLWKGDYGYFRKYAQGIAAVLGIMLSPMATGAFHLFGLIGVAGGEIGFYDTNGSMFSESQLEQDFGLLSTTMEIFDKKSGKPIADAKGGSWPNGYNLFNKSKPGDMYLKGTLQFSSSDYASDFKTQLDNSINSAQGYEHNGKNKINITIDEKDARKLIIIWIPE